MSARYIQRLRQIRGEYQSARQAIRYINENWDRHHLYREVEGITRTDFKRTADRVEATYILRLFAELEGILESHLTTNHSGMTIPKDRKVDWLISRVLRAENLTLDAALRANIGRVREYRNTFAHSGKAPVVSFTLRNVLSWLDTFLAKLPEPNR